MRTGIKKAHFIWHHLSFTCTVERTRHGGKIRLSMSRLPGGSHVIMKAGITQRLNASEKLPVGPEIFAEKGAICGGARLPCFCFQRDPWVTLWQMQFSLFEMVTVSVCKDWWSHWSGLEPVIHTPGIQVAWGASCFRFTWKSFVHN